MGQHRDALFGADAFASFAPFDWVKIGRCLGIFSFGNLRVVDRAHDRSRVPPSLVKHRFLHRDQLSQRERPGLNAEYACDLQDYDVEVGLGSFISAIASWKAVSITSSRRWLISGLSIIVEAFE